MKKSVSFASIGTQRDEKIHNLCQALLDSVEVENQKKGSASNKRILTYFGIGATIATSLFAPRMALLSSTPFFKNAF